MRKKVFLVFSLAVIFRLAFLISQAAAEEKPKAETSKTQTSKTTTPNVNNITQTAVKAGALSCASRINQVAIFLTAGSPSVGALMFLPPNNSDQQMISTSMEIPMKDASSAYASEKFCPQSGQWLRWNV